MTNFKIKNCVLPILTILIGALFYSPATLAKAPDQAEFKAGSSLAAQIADWVGGLQPLPKSLGIFNVYANEPFEGDYSSMIEAEITKHLHQKQIFEHVSSCSECRSPQINIEGELLVIRKGMTYTVGIVPVVKGNDWPTVIDQLLAQALALNLPSLPRGWSVGFQVFMRPRECGRATAS